MRAFALGLIFSVAAVPCLAQTIRKSEPFILAPYEIAFVQDASCPIGKVLKVELPSPGHLYWPDLDIDLAVESIDHPERFPLVSQVRPNMAPPRSGRRTSSR